MLWITCISYGACCMKMDELEKVNAAYLEDLLHLRLSKNKKSKYFLKTIQIK